MILTKQTDLKKPSVVHSFRISLLTACLKASFIAEKDCTETKRDFKDSCHLPLFIVLLTNTSVFSLGVFIGNLIFKP